MSERAWTKEQLCAIEAESGTLLVAAGAGSGKTSVLVERIVRKITSPEGSLSPDSLLVVTFTNAAAAEMRARIYSRVAEKAAEEIGRKSFFSALLSRLGDMRICTMDAFCMSLVKENCHSLGFEPDFRMLDEGEAAQMKKTAAAKVCEERFADNADGFLSLARIFDAGLNDEGLVNSIIKLSDFAMSQPDPDSWLDGTAAKFLPCKAKESEWGRIISENAASELKYASELLKSAADGLKSDEELFYKLSPLLESDSTAVDNAAKDFASADWDGGIRALERGLADIKSRRFSAPRGYSDNPLKKAAAKKRDEVKAIFEKLSELMCGNEQENAADTLLLQGAAQEMVKTVKAYNALLAEMKKKISAFDFPDILHFALSLLIDPDAQDGKTPLAGELSESFSEILIDEYQDTNHAQDAVFCTLSKNGENMFMVGDVKQSIYGFRLASPEIFTEKLDSFPYYDGRAKKSKIILSKNFRSRGGIINGVNFVFSSLMSKECGETDYNDDERLNFGAEYYPDKEKIAFEAAFIEAGNEKTFSVEARYIAGTVKRMLNENERVFSSGLYRGARPSDFCILLRSPSQCAVYFIDELRKQGLPVAADSLENFFDTAEIKTIVSYLRAIDNPGRDIDLLAVMLSPLFGFTPDDAARLRTASGEKESLYSSVKKAAENGSEKCQVLTEKLAYFKKTAAICTVSGLIRDIYADSLYPVIAGSGENGEMKKNNLHIFLDFAEKKSTEASLDLSGFIRCIEILRENGAQPSSGAASGDGVRLMSMHRSKGLEFPFVFIAGCSKDFNKSDIRSNLLISSEYGLGIKVREPENIKLYDSLSSAAVKLKLTSQQMSEELRIYYVAMTRAREKLFIVCALNNAEKRLEEAEYFNDGTKTVPPHLVKGADCAAKWVYSALLRHPDADALRRSRLYTFYDESRAEIKFIPNLPEKGDEDNTHRLFSADEKTVAEIKRRASFTYKYAPIAAAASKHAASSLRSEHFDPAGFGKSVPGFMFASALSPEDRGTATHLFLQYCSFEKCRKDISAEKERLISEGRLTEKQANAVDCDAIADFTSSDIVRRAERADICTREKKFTIAKSICDIDGTIPDRFRNERTVVIGKIDLVFVEDGSAVIVDYKTDRINDISVLKERYYRQMSLYREAVKASTGLNVKECILYSLKLKKYISLSFED